MKLQTLEFRVSATTDGRKHVVTVEGDMNGKPIMGEDLIRHSYSQALLEAAAFLMKAAEIAEGAAARREAKGE